ncbi:response regulator [Stenotrophomonas sp. SY1]|uniref:response regulator n=1 Tax=Stenotrophomonas sp. SY1 TaxID=477235 RepID=UPI001E47DA1F|nr:response regulator [Stenotrophomonas sp. SY1]
MEQLSFLGQTVVSAQNGEEALALWKWHGFDMVITDCCMPVMDGYTLSRCIRDEEKARGVKPCAVIGYTANVLPEERVRCLDAGMDDCLFKPLTLSALSSQLATLQGSSVANDSVAGVTVDGSMVAMVRALTGDDDGLACVFLDEAIDSFRHDVVTVLAWKDDPQVAALAALAHGIKGGARMVDAGESVRACERVEEACQQHPHDQQALEAAVRELAVQLETTIAQATALRAELGRSKCTAVA